MDVRAQVAVIFHLDKCIGCHTCSVACKNVWTDRPGAEYMWWNNVETKPGTGYPTRWEQQDKFNGGWKWNGHGPLDLRCQSKADALLKLFYNPNQPNLDDYYEPFTYKYEDLFNAPPGDDQPTAVPISQITGEPIEIKSGPNWDDDLSGSPLYAENDLNLDALTEEERAQLFEIERMTMFYLPRICNHCANPSCVAACPSGAIYKRGEDGIVLINQEKCRGWRACVAACPYKKIYYNWKTGKSEKCILCFPRLETGQPPACFHSCVGRIRYLGVMLFDADRVPAAMKVSDRALVESQRAAFLDPNDPQVMAAARENGLNEVFLEAAQKSPAWKYIMEWKLALPLHIEYRTMPMLFYVPPLLPIMGHSENGTYEHPSKTFFSGLEKSRLPMKYLASLFSAGNQEIIDGVLKKLMAVRYYKRWQNVRDLVESEVQKILRDARTTADEAEAIYRMTALPTQFQRYVLPPLQREEAIQNSCNPETCKGCSGFSMTPSLGPRA
ncbi:MAG TPA: nitrate reductase subunit beta [Candidatus Paceibacterota bacterium]|nr:nitrate reductase subunit beta [Candidatus Paceibacterota bacterium]HSA02878.1 nitrate reductase subunit beta [Candidatus Paceibacterota bacterium]